MIALCGKHESHDLPDGEAKAEAEVEAEAELRGARPLRCACILLCRRETLLARVAWKGKYS